jgi:hypothetical protein
MRRNPAKSGKHPFRRMQRVRGDAVCVTCLFESAMVAAHRCPDCDGEVCGFCVVLVEDSGELLCPDCAAELQGGAVPSA